MCYRGVFEGDEDLFTRRPRIFDCHAFVTDSVHFHAVPSDFQSFQESTFLRVDFHQRDTLGTLQVKMEEKIIFHNFTSSLINIICIRMID